MFSFTAQYIFPSDSCSTDTLIMALTLHALAWCLWLCSSWVPHGIHFTAHWGSFSMGSSHISSSMQPFIVSLFNNDSWCPCTPVESKLQHFLQYVFQPSLQKIKCIHNFYLVGYKSPQYISLPGCFIHRDSVAIAGRPPTGKNTNILKFYNLYLLVKSRSCPYWTN